MRVRGRSWPQRLLITFNCVVILACLLSAAGLLYVQRQVSAVPRLAIGGVLDDKEEATEPQNILLVGIDDGRGLDSEDPVLTGRGTSLNTDTIMVLRLDPDSDRAALLSFPRDLWVPIAGSSNKAKINSALALGGPERLVATIQQNFGIPIHHYVQVNFAGFKQLVDEIGGVPMYFPWLSRDVNSGWANDELGCITLDRDQALAFTRSRYFQIDEGRGWVSDPYHDLNRIKRQQAFIRAALKQAIAQGARNPFVLNGLVGVAQRSVTLDDQLTTQDIVDLAGHFREFDPDQLELFTAPTEDGHVGEAAVQFLIERQAQPIFDIFRGVDAEADVAANVRVEVRNGSGRSGEGAEARAGFEAHGFVVARAVDAASFQVVQTEVRYLPGEEAAAVEVARHLDGRPSLVEDPDVPDDVTVVVVTGEDFTGVRSEPRPTSDFRSFLDQHPTSTTTPPTTVAPAGEAADPDDPASSTTTTTDPALRYIPRTPEGESCG